MYIDTEHAKPCFISMNEVCLSCEWVKCKKFRTYNKYFSFKVIYWQSGSLLPIT